MGEALVLQTVLLALATSGISIPPMALMLVLEDMLSQSFAYLLTQVTAEAWEETATTVEQLEGV